MAAKPEYNELKQKVKKLEEEIADYKLGEEKLIESEKRYHALFDNNPYGIQEIDTFGTILFVNKAHQNMYGYEEGSLIGRSITDFLIPGEQRDELPGYLKMLLKDQPPPSPYNQKILTKHGKELECEVVWNYLRDTADRVTGFISVLTDITKSKQTEDALKMSEEKYRLLFTGEQDAIVLVDAETQRIIDTNDSALHLYGYSRKEILKLCGSDLSAEPEKSRVAIKKIAEQTNQYIDYHTRLHKKKDGTVFPVEISSGNFILQDKKIVSAMIRDISARKKAEEELTEYRNNLEQMVDVRTAELADQKKGFRAEKHNASGSHRGD